MNPTREFTQMNMAPAAAASLADPKSKIIINFFLGNLSARTPPNGPVSTTTIATINNIDDKALAFPVVSYIHTPIAKKDIADPVQETVWPNQRRYTFLLTTTQYQVINFLRF